MQRDYTGLEKDNYTIINRLPDYVSPNGRKHTRWECVCKCGTHFNVLGDNIKRTKSCGCIRALKAKEIGEANNKHGDAAQEGRTRLYRIWSGIKSRCLNPNHHEYYRYGGSGIGICEEWKNSYPAFKEWACAKGYADDLSIDRIDGCRGYSPDNCRWATTKMQQNNLKSNVHIVVDGRVMTIAQVCDLFEVPHHIVLYKKNSGWSDEQIIEYLRGGYSG